VKILPIKEKDQAALRKEIDVLKKCRCPNILSYYGTIKSNKQDELWVLMDCCDAGSVKDLMKVTLETLDEDQIGYVTMETLKGLAYLHHIKVLHLDVKSANILVTKEGGIKLADFGVSEQLQSIDVPVQATDFVGSPLFMAPEVILKQGYNHKADTWSLGITIIEMAEGRPPNTDITNMTALLQIPNRPPPKLKNQKQWSPSMNDFLSKCMVKDPTQRPAAFDMLIHPFVTDAKGPDALKSIIKEGLSLRRGQIPV